MATATTKKTSANVSKAKTETKTVQTKKTNTKSAGATVGNILARHKKLIIVLSIVVVLASLAYLGRGLVIAATVNGQPISRFQIISEAEKQLGQSTLEKEIARSLVFQEAAKKNITASEEDIDKETKKISDQLKAQGQNLNELLVAQGIEQEDFRSDIKIQLLVQKILGDQVKVSDKEVDDFIAKNEGMVAQEQDQAKAKESIKLQLQQQKLSQKYQDWITKLRADAKILQFVNYK